MRGQKEGEGGKGETRKRRGAKEGKGGEDRRGVIQGRRFSLPVVAARRQESCCIRSLCQIGEREKETEREGFFMCVCVCKTVYKSTRELSG